MPVFGNRTDAPDTPPNASESILINWNWKEAQGQGYGANELFNLNGSVVGQEHHVIGSVRRFPYTVSPNAALSSLASSSRNIAQS